MAETSTKLSEEQIKILEESVEFCERGQTLLASEEGNAVFYGKIQDGLYLCVSWYHENYPAFHTFILQKTEQEIADEINEFNIGWFVRKIHISGVATDEDGCVALIGGEE